MGRSGPERVLSLLNAGVEPLVLAGEVEAPVLLEVAVRLFYSRRLFPDEMQRGRLTVSLAAGGPTE